MMQKKFTQGNWTACCLDQPDKAPHFVFSGDDYHPAVCSICVNDPKLDGFIDIEPVLLLEEANANAKLIQAAPDLFNVVEDLIESAEYWGEYDVPIGIVDRMKAAIKKATE